MQSRGRQGQPRMARHWMRRPRSKCSVDPSRTASENGGCGSKGSSSRSAAAGGGRRRGSRTRGAEGFHGRTVLLRLLEGVLGRNVTEAHARACKLLLGAHRAAFGARLEPRRPWMREGDDVAPARAAVTSLWQMADTSPVIATLFIEPALSLPRAHFEPALVASLTGLFASMELAASAAFT
jgi:hypothetical protein